jgi:hypothetical protein
LQRRPFPAANHHEAAQRQRPRPRLAMDCYATRLLHGGTIGAEAAVADTTTPRSAAISQRCYKYKYKYKYTYTWRGRSLCRGRELSNPSPVLVSCGPAEGWCFYTGIANTNTTILLLLLLRTLFPSLQAVGCAGLAIGLALAFQPLRHASPRPRQRQRQ